MKKLLVSAIVALTAVGGTVAHAQAWPSAKPVRLIAVFPPGGSVDQVARILAEGLRIELKQTVVVENIGGASGMIGTSAVARAQPDGYTFGVVFDTHAVNPGLKPGIPFDTMKDLTHVTLLGTAPMVVAATKGSPITSFGQLMEQAKAKQPNSYGTIGSGSLGHLAIAQLAQNAGFNWTHVPYRGGGPLMNDAVGGHVPLAIGSLFLIKPHAEAGNVTPLAVTTSQRSKDMPNVPTIAESGFPGFDAPAWWGVIGPAKIPAPIVAQFNEALRKALRDPAISSKLQAQGIQIDGSGPEVFTPFVERQMTTWAKFIKDNNITE
ncbi:tripartite tricarboxylate transporter substrate binding protein [Hydrogenophaga sp.]|uniref:Bug family tripartite tricarboxylate transporter substrate binding protein n=1 Tax=Hydrogenophaga sp. TaxID=1904254 RepID=UPI00272011DF|nr:tripartite tricarboxylate transporter substrate binding protein [Hydrogenophaga sp.]MDO8904431.1 tripartite tricarboxylate transporter substrate binding protein [Hydrogenophaga sp.]